MEYYLIIDIDMWFIVTEGFATPISEYEKVFESRRWTAKQRKMTQSKTKATVTLQC